MQKNTEIKNIKAEEVKVNFHLSVSLYVIVKMFLRGVDSVSYSQPIISRLQQAKIGGRVAVEITDPVIGKYTVVAVRKTETTGILVTAWRDEKEDVGKRARQLLEVAYQVVFENGISSWDIKKEKPCHS